MHIVEWLGVLAGATCVLLGMYEIPWTWPVGILNCIFFFVLFWSSKLYADACLQLVYIAISIYGWWNWLHGGEQKSELKVSRAGPHTLIMLAAATALSTAILHRILIRYTDSTVPLWDALTTCMSLAAQFLLGRKHIENWIVWFSVDVIYIALYMYKSLHLTAGLYLGFMIMAVFGFAKWRRSMLGPSAEALPEAASD